MTCSMSPVGGRMSPTFTMTLAGEGARDALPEVGDPRGGQAVVNRPAGTPQ